MARWLSCDVAYDTLAPLARTGNLSLRLSRPAGNVPSVLHTPRRSSSCRWLYERENKRTREQENKRFSREKSALLIETSTSISISIALGTRPPLTSSRSWQLQPKTLLHLPPILQDGSCRTLCCGTSKSAHTCTCTQSRKRGTTTGKTCGVGSPGHVAVAIRLTRSLLGGSATHAFMTSFVADGISGWTRTRPPQSTT